MCMVCLLMHIYLWDLELEWEMEMEMEMGMKIGKKGDTITNHIILEEMQKSE